MPYCEWPKGGSTGAKLLAAAGPGLMEDDRYRSHELGRPSLESPRRGVGPLRDRVLLVWSPLLEDVL